MIDSNTNTSLSVVQSLFSNFKSIVELVIKFPGDSLTVQYGAIERIRSAIFTILAHGFDQTTGDFYDHFWQLIIRFNSNSQKHLQLLQDVYHHDDARLSVEQWINQSLLTHCLFEQLAMLENDNDLLEYYYNPDAFLRNPSFYHALMICIRTIETSDPSLLASIEPKLSIVGLDHAVRLTNDVVARSYSTTTPPTRRNINNVSAGDNQEKMYSTDKHPLLHRRIHSDPIYHFEMKARHPSDLSSSCLLDSIQLNREENLSNHSFSIHYGSMDDSYLSIEQSAPNDINQEFVTTEIQATEKDIPSPMNATFDRTNARLSSISFSRPRKGQTLDNYIREYHAQTRTDVEKENAHFYFSEAIISAIEYVKFNQECEKYFQPVEDPTVTLNHFDTKFSSNESSAEVLALTIMTTWKNYKIPTVADLFWMIPHERDLSDEMISLPDSGTIKQNDHSTAVEESDRILRRGISQWAPLRDQLIFHIHPSVNRDVQLKKQSYQCPGCGRDLEKRYANRHRYCEYTGKYFCRSCHVDKKFYLPSFIITKWDSSNKHSVSNYAYDYLNRIFNEPIFNLKDVNPQLFERSRKLQTIDEFRWALYSLRYYIMVCRQAENEGFQKLLLTLPAYVYEQPHVYSLNDLVKLKLRELQKIYEPIVNNLRAHVLKCPSCYAKGFICEICNNDKNIIFPFDIQRTSVCPVCQSCFHIQCYKNQKYVCPKCQRNIHRNTLTSANRFYI